LKFIKSIKFKLFIFFAFAIFEKKKNK